MFEIGKATLNDLWAEAAVERERVVDRMKEADSAGAAVFLSY